MNILHLTFGFILVIAGIIAVKKNKLYKDEDRNSFVFFAKIKLFGAGIIAAGAGLGIIINELSKF